MLRLMLRRLIDALLNRQWCKVHDSTPCVRRLGNSFDETITQPAGKPFSDRLRNVNPLRDIIPDTMKRSKVMAHSVNVVRLALTLAIVIRNESSFNLQTDMRVHHQSPVKESANQSRKHSKGKSRFVNSVDTNSQK